MWSDRETTHDCLGFESYVESLATVCLEPEIAPLTLGVFGSWGSGKTSLMKMLQSRIEQQSAEEDGKKIKTVWANAWRYEGKDEIQSALIYSILAKLKEEKGLVQDAKDLFERLKKGASILKLGKFIGKTLLTMTPDIGAFIDCFKEESEKLAETMAQFETDFGDLLNKVDVARIVVFIDDLDRCQSIKVIETFETIKLFLNIPECTFVIGADASKIEQAIRDYYRLDGRALEPEQVGGRTFSEDYLEKIVQIPFRIPEQGLRDIACYVGMLALQGQIESGSWKDLITARRELIEGDGTPHQLFIAWLSKREHACFKTSRADALAALQQSQPYVSILARGLRGNPRQIKRFLNILELRQRLAKANALSIAKNVLIKVLVLEYTWRWFFQEVTENFDAASGRSELLAELIRLHSEGCQEDPESPVLTRALTTPGLPEFLSDSPSLHELDLSPYFFLAQTALHVKPLALTPTDEVARVLADKVSDPDRIRSKAAAREASKSDGIVAAAVVRALVSRLQIDTDPRVQVHVVTGLATICGGHPACLQISIDGLRDASTSLNEAAAVAAVPLMQVAEQSGIDVATIRERLGGRSRIAKALDTGSEHRLKTGSPNPKKG